MSTRRSPGLKGRSINASSSENHSAAPPALPISASSNGHHHHHHHTKGGGGIGSSPKSTKSKRSCTENGRLCLLRNRGRSCWLGLLLLGAVFLVTHATLQRLLQEKDIFPASAHQRLRMAHDDDDAGDYGDDTKSRHRILSQSITGRIGDTSDQPWKTLTGRQLFQQAHYQPKPLMMGVLLIPTRDSMKHYNSVDRRSQQNLEDYYPSSKSSSSSTTVTEEKFQIVRINHQDHGQIQFLDNGSNGSNDKKKKEVEFQQSRHQKLSLVEWTFENVLVDELGNGLERQKDITKDSKDYNRYKPDAAPMGCEPQYEWQSKSFPNCNELHQVDILTRIRTLNPAEEPESILLARGGYRDVWFVEQNDLPPKELGETVAVKTLLYEHPWTERNMDRHRRDALATDRLKRSPNALDLFAYCGNTGVYEFADGGSLEDAVDNVEYKKWTSAHKMKYAYQVAVSIADVHNIDKEGVPSMSHTDISMSQFVSVDDGKNYKINDFNRARFLYRDIEDPTKLCNFEVSSNKGKFRSPEEYAYKPESAAIDTYSMGNIFYVLLMGEYPFEEQTKKEVKEMVRRGERPEIDAKYIHSSDPYEQALVEAMRKCWIQNPIKRATSREIEQYLKPHYTTAIQELEKAAADQS